MIVVHWPGESRLALYSYLLWFVPRVTVVLVLDIRRLHLCPLAPCSRRGVTVAVVIVVIVVNCD